MLGNVGHADGARFFANFFFRNASAIELFPTPPRPTRGTIRLVAPLSYAGTVVCHPLPFLLLGAWAGIQPRCSGPERKPPTTHVVATPREAA